MHTKADAAAFERFIRRCRFDNKTPEQVLTDFVRGCTGDTARNLVTELELIDELMKRGIQVSRVTLRKHRRAGKLKDANDRPLFGGDGRYIAYDLDGCVAYFKRRSAERAI
jgi:hypothetical protein